MEGIYDLPVFASSEEKEEMAENVRRFRRRYEKEILEAVPLYNFGKQDRGSRMSTGMILTPRQTEVKMLRHQDLTKDNCLSTRLIVSTPFRNVEGCPGRGKEKRVVKKRRKSRKTYRKTRSRKRF